MTFNKCSVGGICYGDVIDEKTGEVLELSEVSKVLSYFSGLFLKLFAHLQFFAPCFVELSAFRFLIKSRL